MSLPISRLSVRTRLTYVQYFILSQYHFRNDVIQLHFQSPETCNKDNLPFPIRASRREVFLGRIVLSLRFLWPSLLCAGRIHFALLRRPSCPCSLFLCIRMHTLYKTYTIINCSLKDRIHRSFGHNALYSHTPR